VQKYVAWMDEKLCREENEWSKNEIAEMLGSRLGGWWDSLIVGWIYGKVWGGWNKILGLM